MAKTGFVSGAGAHGPAFDGAGEPRRRRRKEEHRREVGEGFLRLQGRHFPDDEVSFPGVWLGIVQRRLFMEELKGLDFSLQALLVDKRRLHRKTPLQYRGTFYRVLSGLLYNNLYRTVLEPGAVVSSTAWPAVAAKSLGNGPGARRGERALFRLLQ